MNLSTVRSGPRAPWWSCACWLLVGSIAGVGVLSLLTIGALLVIVAGVLGVAGALIPALRNGSAWSLLSGTGTALLIVAWLNRRGPGDVCEGTARGDVTCAETSNPWPFLVLGLVLFIVPLVLARRPRAGQSATSSSESLGSTAYDVPR